MPGFAGAASDVGGLDPRQPGGLREKLEGLRKRLGAMQQRPQGPQGMDQGMAAFRDWRQTQQPPAPAAQPADTQLPAPQQFRQPIPRGGYTGKGLTTNASPSPLGRGVGSIGGGFDF